jgi:hypothetical protein
MRILLGLLADAASTGEFGKLHIHGEFQNIYAPELPARHGSLAIVARFRAGADEVPPDGMVGFRFEVVGPPKETSAGSQRSPEFKVLFQRVSLLPESEPFEALLIMQLEGLVLNRYGQHEVQFFRDGGLVGSIGFTVSRPTARKRGNP